MLSFDKINNKVTQSNRCYISSREYVPPAASDMKGIITGYINEIPDLSTRFIMTSFFGLDEPIGRKDLNHIQAYCREQGESLTRIRIIRTIQTESKEIKRSIKSCDEYDTDLKQELINMIDYYVANVESPCTSIASRYKIPDNNFLSFFKKLSENEQSTVRDLIIKRYPNDALLLGLPEVPNIPFNYLSYDEIKMINSLIDKIRRTYVSSLTQIHILMESQCEQDYFLRQVLPYLSVKDLILIKKFSNQDYEEWIKRHLDVVTIKQIEENESYFTDCEKKDYRSSTLKHVESIVECSRLSKPSKPIISLNAKNICDKGSLEATLLEFILNLPILYIDIFLNASTEQGIDINFCREKNINMVFYLRVCKMIKQMLSDIAIMYNVEPQTVINKFLRCNTVMDVFQQLGEIILSSKNREAALLLLNKLGLSKTYTPELTKTYAEQYQLREQEINDLISDEYSKLHAALTQAADKEVLSALECVAESVSKADEIANRELTKEEFRAAANELTIQQLIEMRTKYLVVYRRFIEPYLNSSTIDMITSSPIDIHQANEDDVYKQYLSLLGLKFTSHIVDPISSQSSCTS